MWVVVLMFGIVGRALLTTLEALSTVQPCRAGEILGGSIAIIHRICPIV